uniref:Actin-related protein 5 n=1 Tax=Steinernema glaseri TaxID=37863 RepID=A0A1I7YM16_9BILA
MLNGKIMQGYVKQLRIGGKHLTEKLKEWISYRHVIVQNDMWLVNECKEKACFVSQNFTQDERTISARNNSISCDYTLPDCYDLYEGVVHEPNSNTKSKYIYAQSFKMGMERIATPEILFRPSDIGVKSMGIAEGVWNTIRSLPERYWGRILQNIILVGGNTKFPGFKQRLINDLRPIVPQLYSIQVTQPENPDTYIWHCAKRVAEVEDEFGFVTRKEYLDRGLANCRQRFDRNMQV